MLTIVVPCYNEEKNIPLILERFSSVITRKDITVLLVDNGSTDNSADVIKKLLPSYKFARSVKVDINQGYGFGILFGLKNSKTPFLGWTHADMQTDPGDVIKALELLEKSKTPEKTYVKGLRKGRSLFDQFFTTGMSIFESVYLRANLYDINAQPNIFSKEFFESWDHPPHDFSLDLFALYMARKQKLNLIRMPVIFPPRIHGTSSWNTGLKAKWKFIKRTIDFSLKLKQGLV
jgi:glycosyltransferase involved in cell wall biosynthesis